jgi:hypothetical protein
MLKATLVLALLLLCGCSAILSELESISDNEATSATPTDGLREALRIGTGRAVDRLGRTDGYLGSKLFRIPVPEKLEPIEKALRAVGADSVVDRFETSMNRAAEAAAPVARDVFVETVMKIEFEDALAILRGERHEATDYLREHAGEKLATLFRPIVAEQLDSVGATRRFGELVERTARLPFINSPELDLTDYVTGKALDGLFGAIAQEEEKIRKDPVARTTELLRRFFGDA